MKTIFVISPGVPHAIPRTTVLTSIFRRVYFYDFSGKAEKHGLERDRIKCRLENDLPQNLTFHFRFKRLLDALKPDCIICHYASGDHFFHSIAYRKCPVAVIAMGTDVQYGEGDTQVKWMRRFVTRVAIRNCLFVSAKSRRIAARVRQYGYSGNMDVNLWGSDLSLFMPLNKTSCRKKLGIPENTPVVLSPRAVEKRYNIDMIIKACGKLVSKYSKLLLIQIGRYQADYRIEIEKLIHDLGLGENVRLTYEVNHESLPDYYCASDVVVSMARSEGFPNTLLETMACGAVNIVGRIPAIEDVLRDGHNVVLCEPEITSIAASIDRVLSNPDDYGQLVQNAREFAVKYGDIEKNGRRFSELLLTSLACQEYPARCRLEKYYFNLLFICYCLFRKIGLS